YCPLCTYNLRGLIEPRCPECGHRSTWKDLLAGGNLPHPYLFEHHPEANKSSFFRTLLHSLEPVSFWRRLKPAHQPNPRRLMTYWSASTGFTLALLCMIPLIFFLNYSIRVRSYRASLAAGVSTWPQAQRDFVVKHYGSATAWANQ